MTASDNCRNLLPEILLTGKKKILIVDDMMSNAALIKLMLGNYDCDIALSGSEALQKIAAYLPDVILLDVMMPDMDGFAVCAQVKRQPELQNVPIVMVTALEDKQSKLKGLEAGANEFLTKPIDAAELTIRIANILKVKEYSDFLTGYNETLCEKLAERTRDLENSYQETICRLTISAEFKDADTGSHIKRISHYTRYLASLLGYSDIRVLELASQMHDIGKIGIPDHVLLKKGRLTADEFEIMKTHSLIGGRILDNSTSPILQAAKTVALHHHERWDGSGYPFGLAGPAIPAEGLIVAIADQYDALRMRRPYKPPFSHDVAFKIITQGDGRTLPEHFSPVVLAAFINSHHVFADIFAAYKDDEAAAPLAENRAVRLS